MMRTDDAAVLAERISPLAIGKFADHAGWLRIALNVNFNLDTLCMEWAGARTRKGYGTMWYQGRSTPAHRVAWLTVHGPIPDGGHVLHHCDNPPCVNPLHLYVGSNDDNVRDRVARGRSARNQGAAHPAALIDDSDVAEIRRLAARGMSAQAIAARYPISRRQCHRIITGEAWRHLP